MYLHIIELIIFIGGAFLVTAICLYINKKLGEKVYTLIENDVYAEDTHPELGGYAYVVGVLCILLFSVPILKLCYFVYSLIYAEHLRSPYYCSIFNAAHFVFLYMPLCFFIIGLAVYVMGIIIFGKDWLHLFVLIMVYDFIYKTNKTDYRICKEKKANALKGIEDTTKWLPLIMYIFLSICCIGYLSMKNDNFVLMPTEIQFGYKSYDYSDVAEIYLAEKTVAPIGKIIEEDHVIIVFDDGRMWNDRNHKAMSDAAVRFLEIKSGVEAVEVEYAPDL